MLKYKLIFVLCLILLILLSCSPNLPSSFGKARQIIILTNYRTTIEKEIQYSLQQNVYTVQPEPEFLVRFELLNRINDFMKFHLIFLVGTIDEEPINTILSNQLDKIKNDTFGLFAFNEPWASRQKVLVFAVSNMQYLETGLKRYGKRIQKSFQDYLLNYMSTITYERNYEKKLSHELSQKFNFTFKVPLRFNLVSRYEKDNFIYLVAHNPDRSIFVYTKPKIFNLDPSEIIAFRDSLTKRFYEGDFVYQNYTYAETTDFNGIIALKIRGVWQNNNLIIGGPFISYSFNYNNRFYFIDGVLYNPGKKKLDNLYQLDAILNTFKINN